jgi:peptidoglycan/LPS O-acetylase OafA/YrhL
LWPAFLLVTPDFGMQLRGPSPNLDLLRAVAVTLVLIDHVTITFGLAQRHPALYELGRWGVLLFFIHTSCVLMMSLARISARGWRMPAIFYIRRIFRIYPLSVITVSIVLIAHIPELMDQRFHQPDAAAVAFNYLLCGNITRTEPVLGPLWSLPFEVEMYALLPFVFLFICRSGSPRRLAFSWLAAAAVGLLQGWLATVRGLGIERLNLAEFGPCFLSGVGAYFLATNFRRPKLPAWIWPVSIAAATAAFLYTTDWPPKGMLNARLPGWLICAALGCVATACAEIENHAVQRAAHYVAKYSYGLYLSQVPVLWFAFVWLKNASLWQQCAVFAALIVIVPVLSFHLIESPFIQIGGKLTEAFLPDKAAAAGVTAAAEYAKTS